MNENNFLPPDQELYRRVYEIAHYMWDPIGVSEHPQAHDEYKSYLLGLYGRVKTGEASQVVEYMKCVVTENMGMIFDREKAEKAANAMIEWKEYIDSRAGT